LLIGKPGRRDPGAHRGGYPFRRAQHGWNHAGSGCYDIL